MEWQDMEAGSTAVPLGSQALMLHPASSRVLLSDSPGPLPGPPSTYL